MWVIGLKKRTCNREAQETMPIIWGEFGQRIAEIPGNGPIMAVYTNYESDYGGYYDYYVGKRVLDPNVVAPQGMRKIEIPDAIYKNYHVEGEFPQEMIKQWEEIWAEDLVIPRKYEVDYEVYFMKGEEVEAVDIFISLKTLD